MNVISELISELKCESYISSERLVGLANVGYSRVFRFLQRRGLAFLFAGVRAHEV